MCIVQSAVHYKCLIMQNVHVTGIFKVNEIINLINKNFHNFKQSLDYTVRQ